MKKLIWLALVLNLFSGSLNGFVVIFADTPKLHNYLFTVAGFSFAILNYIELRMNELMG